MTMFIHKLKAFGIHLLLSFVIISFAIGLIIYFWFPDSMIKVSNFKEIALLIVFIDLILGPLLTFVIYKPMKKGLKFDISAIATLQVCALTYGLFTLYQAHPVYIAFNVDRFTLISAIDARPENATKEEFNVSKLASPKLVVAKIPTDIKARSELVLEITSGQPDIALRPELYHSYEDNISTILEKSLDPDVIFKSEIAKEKLANFIKKHGNPIKSYAFFPLEGPDRDAVWALDGKTAKPVGIIPVDPWVTKLAIIKKPETPNTTKN